MGKWFFGCVVGYVLVVYAMMYANTAVLHLQESELGWEFDALAWSVAYAPLTVVALLAACAVPLRTWQAGLLMCGYFSVVLVALEVTFLIDIDAGFFVLLLEWLALAAAFFIVSTLIARKWLSK
ncbi:MAG TPA: hypothetical protein VEI07_05900 [Planctomycetaceae bacterium]|nr:hypothetical protein [Planctomycetaceae bacterium]